MTDRIYRGQTLDGEWIVGHPIHIEGKTYFLEEGVTAKNINGHYLIEVTNIGMRTPYTDRNNIRIYEGDILLSRDLISDDNGDEDEDYWEENVMRFCQGQFMCGNTQWKDGTHDWHSIENNDVSSWIIIGHVSDRK